MKSRFHLYSVCEESLARQVAETAFALGISQASLLRWAVVEWLKTADARIAALAAAGSPPPPPFGASSVPKSRPNRNRPKSKTKTASTTIVDDRPF